MEGQGDQRGHWGAGQLLMDRCGRNCWSPGFSRSPRINRLKAGLELQPCMRKIRSLTHRLKAGLQPSRLNRLKAGPNCRALDWKPWVLPHDAAKWTVLAGCPG